MKALLFAEVLFTTMKQVRMWLASQGSKHDLGDLAVRPLYCMAHSRHSWLVRLQKEVLEGTAHDMKSLLGSDLVQVELAQGVTGYRVDVEEAGDGEADPS